jgi:glucosylceramidase
MVFFASCSSGPSDPGYTYWLTDPADSILFELQKTVILSPISDGEEMMVIEIDTSQQFQSMDGFGFTLTGGSAMHLQAMTPAARQAVFSELFGKDEQGIGISFLRISIGASDLDDYVFSYNDLPKGETDTQLNNFSLDNDRRYLIPVLKEILAINPDILIMGSPWSPPAWMKSNQSAIGGSLRPEFYSVYAMYFVKYIREMEREGIPVHYITVQNEPLHPGNNPSMLMQADEQAKFIKSALGPAFEAEAIHTKIVIYDHNADRTDYPISILNDPDARKYIWGSAFHLYGGTIEAMSEVHDAHPDKSLYFTEQWIGAPGNLSEDLKWHVRNLIIGAPRNWSKTVLEWNLSSDPKLEPHTDQGGCTRCLGAITIDGDKVIRNPAYYIIAHASMFVQQGSIRIASTPEEELPNISYLNTRNEVVLIVLNELEDDRQFLIRIGNTDHKAMLPAGAAGTYIIPLNGSAGRSR